MYNIKAKNLENFDTFQQGTSIIQNQNTANPQNNSNSVRPTIRDKNVMLLIGYYTVVTPSRFETTLELIDFLLSTKNGLDTTALETIGTALVTVFENSALTPAAAHASINDSLTRIATIIKDHKNEVLFTALKNAKEHVVLMLIAMPEFDLNARDASSKKTPLMFAAKKGYHRTVKFLLEKNVNINDKDDYGMTVLMHAAVKGHKNIVALLIEKNANVNDTDHSKWAALMFGIVNGYEDVVELLLRNGAHCNAKDNENMTSLMLAACNGDRDIAKILLDEGCNINDKEDNDGASALMFAAYNNRKEIVALLLEKGANINDTDHDGRTALMIATDNGHHDIVDILQDASKKSAAENVRKKLKMDV